MGAFRRVVLGSAGAVGVFAAGRLAAGRLAERSRHHLGVVDGHELLGSFRGSPRWVRGPRASRIYTEWVEPPASDADAEVAGESGGAVVCTHGWCVTEAVWHHQKEALARGGLRTVTWDLPGHGHSTPVSRSHLTMDLAVDALARVVDEAGPGSVVLVGHSFGGVLTLEYLLRHPQTARRRVRGAVLISTPVAHVAGGRNGHRWPGSSLTGQALTLAMQLAVENGAVDRWFAREAGTWDRRAASYRLIRVGFGQSPAPEHVRFVRDLAASVPPAVRADTFRAMTGFDLRPRLDEIGTPALVVYGGRDRLVSPEDSAMLAARLRRGRALVFPEAGHAVFLEQHQEVSEAVLRFAAGRLAAGAGSRGRRRAPSSV